MTFWVTKICNISVVNRANLERVLEELFLILTYYNKFVPPPVFLLPASASGVLIASSHELGQLVVKSRYSSLSTICHSISRRSFIWKFFVFAIININLHIEPDRLYKSLEESLKRLLRPNWSIFAITLLRFIFRVAFLFLFTTYKI